MKLVFMGTPDFAVTVLAALLAAGHEVVCAYSQPPRKAGRGQALRASPVQAFAEARRILVRTPVSLKSADQQAEFSALGAEAAIVVAYGLLLPKAILDAPRFGCFNAHASLLPRWRGAAPIQRAIMAGDAETGVTIMRMEEGLDTGPMLLRGTLPITPDTTAADLHDALAILGADLMVQVLLTPEQPGTVQPVDGVTYARKIDKAEARLDLTQPSHAVLRHIHGLSPFPGAWFMVRGARIKLLRARVESRSGPAGEFLDDRLLLGCGTGAVRLLTLQREGKGPMDAETFLRGFAIAAGEKAS
jgi:methionyl-tRNA formyltransferase